MTPSTADSVCTWNSLGANLGIYLLIIQSLHTQFVNPFFVYTKYISNKEAHLQTLVLPCDYISDSFNGLGHQPKTCNCLDIYWREYWLNCFCQLYIYVFFKYLFLVECERCFCNSCQSFVFVKLANPFLCFTASVTCVTYMYFRNKAGIFTKWLQVGGRLVLFSIFIWHLIR